MRQSVVVGELQVNARSLQFESTVLHESLLVPELAYDNETMI